MFSFAQSSSVREYNIKGNLISTPKKNEEEKLFVNVLNHFINKFRLDEYLITQII